MTTVLAQKEHVLFQRRSRIIFPRRAMVFVSVQKYLMTTRGFLQADKFSTLWSQGATAVRVTIRRDSPGGQDVQSNLGIFLYCSEVSTSARTSLVFICPAEIGFANGAADFRVHTWHPNDVQKSTHVKCNDSWLARTCLTAQTTLTELAQPKKQRR
jgi:hypothetical protein